jgi:integrase
MASIDRYRDGRWRARWRDPEGASRSQVFARKVDAERHLTAVEHGKLSGAYVDPAAGRLRFGQWWQQWSEAQVGLRPSTLARNQAYGRSLILPTFARRQLASIEYLDVQRWVGELVAAGKAPATVGKACQLLGKSLRAAVRARLVSHDPTDGVELPKVERSETRFLVPSEVATLSETIRPAYRSLVLLGAYGGLRFGELAGLRRARVDLLHARVEVSEIAVEVRGHLHFGPPKTRAGHRSVPLPRFVVEALGEHANALEPGALVFPAPEGGTMRASQFRRRVWQPAVEAAGLDPLRIHDLRHTAVAFWNAAGASPVEIARRAGHTSVVTVLDRYGHLLPGAEDLVTEALEAMGRAVVTPPGEVIELGR